MTAYLKQAAPAQSGLVLPDDLEYGRMALSFAEDLRDDFSQRDRIFNLIDQVIFLEQRVQIPVNYQQTAVEVLTPLPMHIANSITSALTINTPRVHFKPIEFGDTGEETAAYRERFFMGSWDRQQQEKRRRIYRLFMHSVVTKGLGVLKTHERKYRAWESYVSRGTKGDPDYKRGYAEMCADELDELIEQGRLDEDSRSRLFDARTEEYKRGLPYPIETTEIPPETYYYQQGEDGLTRVAEIKEVPYYDTMRQFGAAFDGNGRCCLASHAGLAIPDTQWHGVFPTGGTKRKLIRMIELWDWEYCTIILQGPGDIPSSDGMKIGSGCMVRRYRHTYGDPILKVLRGPYFHASGILTSSRQPHKQNLSVLYAYLHLFPLLNSLLTMQSQAAFSFSYPAYKRTSPPTYGLPDNPFGMDAIDLRGQREKIVPGAIFPHDVAPMDQPRTSVDLDKAITFVRGMIEMALPDTVQGNVTGEMAGYTLNQAARMVSLQWSPIVENVQDTLAQRVGWESYLIETHIGEPVYVWGAIPQPRRRKNSPRTYKDGWMGIGPKELKGAHHYDIELKPVSVNNEQLLLRNIKDKLDMRLITPADAIREIGGNPVEVERGWLLHELKQDQEIRQNLKQRIFQSLATIEQEQMRTLPPGGEPGGAPPVETSPLPGGAQPGVSQGLPPTGFVPPAGATPPAMPPPMSVPIPPGTVPGEPGPMRGIPLAHEPIPGGG